MKTKLITIYRVVVQNGAAPCLASLLVKETSKQYRSEKHGGSAWGFSAVIDKDGNAHKTPLSAWVYFENQARNSEIAAISRLAIAKSHREIAEQQVKILSDAV